MSEPTLDHLTDGSAGEVPDPEAPPPETPWPDLAEPEPDGPGRWARLYAWRPGPAALVVTVLSVVAHLWRLGHRPLAHDEAIDAWFSWQAHTTRLIEYDPVYHGPLRFYLEGLVLGHLGTTPAWARACAAVGGIVATVVILGQRRLLGRTGSVVAALAFVVSPTMLTVTRTGREDSLTGLVSLGLLLIVAHALQDGPRFRHVVGAGALLATSFTLKETTFIFGFAGACFFAGLGVVAVLRPEGEGRRFFGRLRGLGSAPWMWSTVAFVAVTAVVFTAGFRYGAGLASGMVDGIRYWLTQHDVGRGSQRWFFYGTVYVAYEWFVLGAGAIGAIAAIRRRWLPGLWLLTMAVVQFAVYSWAGEKFAWLALHPLLPAALLAGYGAQRVGERLRDRRVVSLAVGLATAAILTATAVVAVRPAITHGADTRELLVTVQTSDRLHELAGELRAARDTGALGAILVDSRDSGSWPWAWYLHGLDDVGWAPVDPLQPLPAGYDAYLVSASTELPPIPAGYSVERFPLRGWWLPDYDDASPEDLLRWFLTREVWSPQGTSDQYLVRKMAAATDGAG